MLITIEGLFNPFLGEMYDDFAGSHSFISIWLIQDRLRESEALSLLSGVATIYC